jgi:hypothetical protein
MRKTMWPFVAVLLTSALLFAAYQSINPSEAAAKGAPARATGVARGSGSCSVSTLKGRYLFAHAGTILPPAFGVSEATPGADAGIHSFNGDGTGSDIVTVRVGSQIFLNNVTVPFTYTVNADCTGEYRVQIDNGPAFNLYADPRGDSVVMISTEPPGNYVSGIDQRVANK